MLCRNRPDGGFGPYFHINGRSILSTCFDDTILIPLGPWLFIVFTAVLVVYRLAVPHQRRGEGDVELSNADRTKDTPLDQNIAQRHEPWRKTRRTLLVFSTFFLVALIAMHALEIARLSANSQGIGLLPFTFVPLLLVLVSLYLPFSAWSRSSARPARPHGTIWMAGVGLWCTWMSIAYGIEIWSLNKVYQVVGKQAYDGNDSKYPYSDKIIDDVVILAVYFVFMLTYLHEMFLEYRRYGWTRFG